MTRHNKHVDNGARQQGVAILAITVILLLVATIGTLVIGRVGVVEQKQAATDLRGKEVYSAAVGGLKFAEDWFEDNWESLVWSDSDGDGNAEAGDTAQMPVAMDVQLNNVALNADQYDRTVVFTLVTDLNSSPNIAEISLLARAEGDSHVEKALTKEVAFGTLSLFNSSTLSGDPTVFNGPPILIEGCLSGVTGNPDIYPHQPNGVAVGTTRGLDPDMDGTQDQALEDCLDLGHFTVHNGGTLESLTSPSNLWCTVFGCDTTEADLRQLEQRSPERILFVDSTYPHYAGQPAYNNNWHNDVGSAAEPVILYFDSSAGCPKINGSTTVYGIVYYEETDCGNQGWGGGKVYGTVAKAGNLDKFTANAEIHGDTLNFGGGGTGSGTEVVVSPVEFTTFAEIPGSWKDF